MEEITREIPNLGEEALKELDERGVIRVGTEVDPGDVLVVNDTKVRPARISGYKETGGKVEVLLLNPLDSEVEVERVNV